MASQNAQDNASPPAESYPANPYGQAGSPHADSYMSDSNINALRSFHGNNSNESGRAEDKVSDNIDPALGSGSGQDGNEAGSHMGFQQYSMGQHAHDASMAALQSALSSDTAAAAAALQAQGMMGIGQDGSVQTPDGSSRKRSKVSRACDECRRKKIRCDFTTAENDAQAEVQSCSNCRRAQVSCEFSRQPQKRGPSRGYIKDLADRVIRLESDRQQGQASISESPNMFGGVSEPIGQHDQTPFATPSGPKRPYSSVDREEPRAWNGPVNTSSMDHFDANSLMNFVSYAAGLKLPLHPAYKNNIQGEDAIVREYGRLIHSDYPILSIDKDTSVSLINSCPEALRDCFYQSLDHLVRTIPGHMLPDDDSTIELRAKLAKTTMLLWDLTSDRSVSTTSQQLVFCQSLIIMAMAAHNYGPKGDSGSLGATTAEMIGRAHSILQTLHLHKIGASLEDHQAFYALPENAEEKFARRLYLILFTIDHMHAMSGTRAPLVSDENPRIHDAGLVGIPCFLMATLMHKLHNVLPFDESSASLSAGKLQDVNDMTALFATLRPNMTEYDTHDKLIQNLGLCICHRFSVQMDKDHVSFILDAAVQLAELCDRNQVLAPFGHHYFYMATLSLVQIGMADPDKRPIASAALTHIEHALQAGMVLGSIDTDNGWDVPLKRYIAHFRSEAGLTPTANGLQHLADAAVEDAKMDADITDTVQGIAAAAQKQMGREVDWVKPLKAGYVKVILDGVHP